jgi:hypothetical protein
VLNVTEILSKEPQMKLEIFFFFILKSLFYERNEKYSKAIWAK